MTKVKVPFKKISRIIQIADIHIRLFKRHKEYRDGFARLYADLAATDLTDTVIVVAGDLAHSKLDMSPELIDLASDFLTNVSNLAPTLLIAGNHDCFTPDHELLTAHGWVGIDEIVNTKMHDKIATWNSSTHAIEWHAPTSYIKRKFDGDMVRFVGRDVDMCVTPTHNVVYYHNATRTYYKKEAKDVPVSGKIPITGIAIESSDPWSELIGFTKADGTIVIKNPETLVGRIQFRLKKERKIKYLCDLLSRLDIPYTSHIHDDVTCICIYGSNSRKIMEEFAFSPAKPLSTSWYTQPSSCQRGLLEGFFSGDGHNHGNNFYSAVSIDFASVHLLTTLARLVGASSHIATPFYGSGYANGKLQLPFTVHLDVGERFSLIENKTLERFVGDVYCVSVPTQNLMVRRNGKIFITGNCNEKNSNRLDALSPIVNNLRHPNLHYLRDSGVYRVADVDFAVMSLIGDRSEWPTAKDCTANTKIALFHGPVHNARTDVGYTVTSRHVTAELFNEFDMALLGDIHSYQNLNADIANGVPVVYASSLLQQNHGENLKGHGWVDWDVSTRTHTFNELVNTYGYYTLTVENRVVPDTSDMPQNVRLRLYAGDMTPSEIKTLVADLRTRHNITELAVNRFAGTKSQRDQQVTSTNFLDINEVSYQNKLLGEYLKTKFDISDELLEEVIKINESANSEVLASDDLMRRLVWKPITMKFDNLFTYGKDNFIDFQNMNGTMGLFSANATGKSSIPDAICFALYDRTPRTTKASSIMNTRETECSLEFIFEVSGTQYMIERRGKKNKKNEVKMDVDFWRMESDGTKTPMNGEQRIYTNAIIRGYVGDYEDFILTALSSQKQNGLFMDRGQSDRKDMLSQFMGLTIFDKVHTIANDISKEVSGQLKKFHADDFTQELVDVETELVNVQLSSETAEKQICDIKLNVDELDGQLQALYEKRIPIPTFKFTIDEIAVLQDRARTKILDIRTVIADMRTAVEAGPQYKSQLDELVKRIADIREKLSRGNKAIVESATWIEENAAHAEAELIAIQKVNSDTWDNKVKLREITQLIESHQRNIDMLATRKYNPDCAICIDNEFVRNAEKSKLLIGPLLADQTTLLEEIDRTTILLEDMDAILSNHKLVVDKRELLGKQEMAIEKLKAELVRCEANTDTVIREAERKVESIKDSIHAEEFKISALESTIINYQTDIVTILEQEDNINFNATVANEIVDVKVLRSSVVSNLTGLEHLLKNSQVSIGILQSKRAVMLKKIEDAKKLETTNAAYQLYLKAVCRDGLPYQMISEVLPQVQIEINNILSQMVEFTVELDVDGKNVNGRIVYDETSSWPIELASGMETFVTGLAIRVALMSVSSLPKSNFLMIDEGLGSLDADNLSSLFMMFDMLKSHFDFIMLISHLDVVRDISDHFIEIKRDGKYSTVQHS